MLKLLFLSLLALSNIVMANTLHDKNCVIVLHGMGRSALSMNTMANALEGEGYLVWNKSYASTKESIQTLATKHINDGVKFCQEHQVTKTHFVTHSLGGILVRTYLQNNQAERIGNIIMLSPPNKGSEVTDLLKEWKIYQWLTGPAGQSLGTEPSSAPNTLKPINAHIGIITGNKSSDPWFSPIIPSEDDGKVSIKSAKLDEMSDFLVVEAGHTFIMNHKTTIDQTLYFLSNGQFKNP